MNLNIDVMVEGGYSDGKLGPFFDSVIGEFQEGEYKEDVVNGNHPSGEVS